MLHRNFTSGILAALILLAPAGIRAQEKTAASYPDMRVMNGILEQLLSGSGKEEHFEANVSGLYLPDYGLIFLVDLSERGFGPEFLSGKLDIAGHLPDMRAFDSSMAAFDSAMAEFGIQMRHFDSTRTRNGKIVVPHPPAVSIRPPRVESRELEYKESDLLSKEDLARLDSRMMKFLGSYADAENKLLPSQHVSVVVLWGDNSQSRYYSVTRKEIGDYRAQKESETVFSRKVQLSELKDRHESVGIMATILDKSIAGKMKGGSRSIFGPHSAGIYLKGIGSIFVCRLSWLAGFEDNNGRSDQEKAKAGELEKAIIRTIGNYGATLRFMPSDESIIVAMRFDQFTGGEESILINVKKKDAEAYSRNEIGYEELRQRALLISYR